MPVSYPSTNDPYPPMESGLEYGLQSWTIKTPAGDIEAWRGDNSWWYEGSGAALVAAQIAESWQVPGDAQCRNKRRFVRRGLLRFGKRVYLSAERQRDGTVRVYIAKTDAQFAHDKAEQEITRLPTCADDFRARVLAYIEGLTEGLSDRLARCFGQGYFFDRTTMETFEWALNEAVKALADGKVKYDAQKRARIVATIRGESSKADKGFQAIITTMLGGEHGAH